MVSHGRRISSLGSTPTAQRSTRLSRTHRPTVESLDRPFFIQPPDDDCHDSSHAGGGGGGASAGSPFLKSFRAAQNKKKEKKGGMSSMGSSSSNVGMGGMMSRSMVGMLGRGDGGGDGRGDEEERIEMRRARMNKRSEWLRSPVKLRAAFSRYKYTVYTAV